MRRLSKKTEIGFFIFFIILCNAAMPCAAQSDLDVWGFLIPGDVLSPGQEASAQYTVSFDLQSAEEGLEFYTDLSDPKWQFAIIIDGVRQELPFKYGRYASICGFELYYPKSHSSQVELKLNGTVPEVAATGNYTIFRVTQYDYEGSSVYEETIKAVFVNPSEINNIRKIREDELAVLRAYIHEKFLIGVDTRSAEEKYGEAATAIETAGTLDAASASSLLSYAKTCMDESYVFTDSAWAKYSIGNTQSKNDLVDGMIGIYEVKGHSNDSRVWVVRSYVDNSKTLLILAEDKFELCDYVSAKDYAEQAGSKSDMAYDYAVVLNEELDIASPAQTYVSTVSTPAQSTVTSSPTSTTAISEIIPDLSDNGGLDDIDDILHSEVDLDSMLKIGGMMADLFFRLIDFLNEIIAMASDN